MDKILLFAGTTEGRNLAEFLEKNQIPTEVCVATQYGETLLEEGKYLHVHAGRLDETEMEQQIQKQQITLVIDATHPYAVIVSQNIRRACSRTGTEYIRLARKEMDASWKQEMEDVTEVASVAEAAAFLAKKEGRIFAATGSKELSAYQVIPDYQDRVVARVLSTPEAVSECAMLGFSGKNLICMQGPFTEDLNVAMLRQAQASWMVTKESGKAGGFLEKLRAAKKAGAKLVVIKRPGERSEEIAEDQKEENLYAICDEGQIRSLLGKRLGICPKRQLYLVGIGMGNEKNRTVEAEQICQSADLLIGARRMLQSVKTEGKAVFESYKPDEIAAYLAEHPQYETAAVLLSGDIGFYSGAKKLYDAIERTEGLEQMEIYPVSGISSVVYFCGKLGVSWEDVHLLSLHGRKQNLIDAVKYHEKVFVLCGEKDGIPKICCKLKEYGLGDVKVAVGTDLSYEQERIVQGTAESLMKEDFAPLSVLLICNPDVKKRIGHGLDDDLFLRGKVPMTKSEVRSISLSKLRLHKDAVVWDVGAGTGSVSIEAASLAKDGVVYAIEKKDEAIDLLEQNKRKFGTDNLEIIKGLAPEALEGLPAPTHAFIGGSSGNLKEILEVLLEQNPRVRVVINAIALETVAEAMQCLKSMAFTDVDIAQVSVAKGKKLGSYEMMMGQNPVYIFSCTGGETA
ncbi:MAG TPA: bifunctional cobalt-precorrin-7 (C(5))-methyltransferase/cobalt-precorrin-6B (C(15))-methyltransferase [Lachnospiraceae bacterium]|nr:bifunctional cobalt-precorrin-7 (C(5))-methyltransferase/cobalt-precorrin-6B (C(15))-methyltransferase [Lachnospiraceae bacterium]